MSGPRPEVDELHCANCGTLCRADDVAPGNGGASWYCHPCVLAEANALIWTVSDAELVLLAVVAMNRDDDRTAGLLAAYDAEARRRGIEERVFAHEVSGATVTRVPFDPTEYDDPDLD